MDSYNLAEAKAHLSELVDRAAAGEEIEIKKRGLAKVKLVPANKPRGPIDLVRMRELTRGQEMGTGAADFVRAMRDSDQS